MALGLILYQKVPFYAYLTLLIVLRREFVAIWYSVERDLRRQRLNKTALTIRRESESIRTLQTLSILSHHFAIVNIILELTNSCVIDQIEGLFSFKY